MQYLLNKRNIKQSLQNLSTQLKEKGYNIPRHILLDALARVLFFKNYNTLDGRISSPHVIEYIPNTRFYMLEIESDISKETLLTYIYHSLQEAKCQARVDNVIFEQGCMHVELHFDHNSNNFLTAMIHLATHCKPHKITRLDFLRVVVERESVLGFVSLP